MRNQTVLSTLPWNINRTKTDILSAILRAARIFGHRKPAVVDSDGTVFSYAKLLRGMFALGQNFSRHFPKGRPVGIMLPTGAATIVTFGAMMVAGRLPAMLNFTAGANTLKNALKTGNINQIVTAHKFVRLARLEPLIAELEQVARIVYLEDIRETLGIMDKISGAIGPVFPFPFRKRLHHSMPAVILFTSGTENTPKGVVLTHHNIMANVEQMRDRIPLSTDSDSVFNPLPTFHCFGLTVGSILPLVAGVRVIFHPTPLQPKEIGDRVGTTGATILLATDTFVGQYARAARKGAFASVRLAVCGAERVRDETRQLVRRHLGMELLEGYGTTETAPVIAANSPETNRPGTVGRPLAGIECKLIPVEGINEGGRLCIRGPNVMTGYMHASAPGKVEPCPDGWHDTGDIASFDEDGHIRIIGRVKRFVKIGGEMVSLAVVENCASAIWPEHMHAAIGVPDQRKGEQINLLTTAREARHETLLAWARSHGVSELSIPRKVFHVDTIPVLGTGKTDYGAVEKIIVAMTQESNRN